MTDLGTALVILRVVRGWSQEELARAAGIRAGGIISDYERGKIVPGAETARKLLAAEGYSGETRCNKLLGVPGVDRALGRRWSGAPSFSFDESERRQ